jgi:hypothetical protein
MSQGDRFLRGCAFVLLLVVAAWLPAKQKKPAGTVADREAFSKVTSYCVDNSGLPSDQAYDVRGFLQAEGKPGKLLSKLSWKLLSDCRESEPDAVITLEFPTQHVVGLETGAVPNPAESSPEDQTVSDYHTVAILRVLDAGSRHLLYEVHGLPLTTAPATNPTAGEAPAVARRDAMYGAFWTLINDLGLLAQKPQP